MLTDAIELPLVVAILFRGRILVDLDLPLLRVLLRQPPSHYGTGQYDAILQLQLSRLCGIWSPHGHDWLPDGIRICSSDL